MTDASSASSRHIQLCPSCDLELEGTTDICSHCGTAAVMIHAGVDPNLGRTIDGRYQLRALLGAGGMASVYRAWQLSVRREVAVKLIDERYRRDLTWIRRFLREARLASRLRHPHTVGILDFGQTDDGDLFLAMELLVGRTLTEVIERDGRFDVARTVRVGIQICDALDAAHGRDIVHRDLKPQNIFILDEPAGRDFVKLLDFGLATSLADEDLVASQISQLIGTPYYVAPELLSRRPASPASDLYALGVILCEAHLGRTLFTSDSFGALLLEKSGRDELPPEIDPALRDLLRDLVEPDPARRPQRASEVAARLEGCASGAPRPLPQRPAPSPVAAAVTVEASPSSATDVAPPERPDAPGMGRRGWKIGVLVVVALAAVAGGIALRMPPAQPMDLGLAALGCERRVETHTDPNTGQSWHQAWHCRNARGVILYAHANTGVHVAYLDRERSQVVCYRHGAPHNGGNDVWYYTQGNWTAPGHEPRAGWGYLPAAAVKAQLHPYPGVPECQSDLTEAERAELQLQIEGVLKDNPGSRQLGRNDVELQRGLVMTIPLPGETLAVGPAEVRAIPGAARCPAPGICVYQHADYSGVRLRLDRCGSYDLTHLYMPGHLRWSDSVSSWHRSGRSDMTATVYDLDGGDRWIELFDLEGDGTPFIGEEANDRIDRIDTCR